MLPDHAERRHPHPLNTLWREEHRVCARSRSAVGTVVVALRVAHHVSPSGLEAASFQALVSVEGRDPVVISEDDIEMPERGWELRTSGLWADHTCETPMRHWSYGLEAFALAIEDPAELLGRGYGERTPLGWELDVESDDPPEAGDGSSYAQGGLLHGLVLLADGELEVEGQAVRTHQWESGPRVIPPWRDDGTGPPVGLPTPDGVWWVATA